MNYRSHPFPWKHYTFENFFEQDDFEKIKNIQINNADYSEITGFRDVIKGRTFLNNEAVDNDNTLLSAAKCLNRKEYFGECFKVDLKDTYMRAEIIHDRYPFFHDVHVDLPCKNLTIIFNVSFISLIDIFPRLGVRFNSRSSHLVTSPIVLQPIIPNAFIDLIESSKSSIPLFSMSFI